MTSETLIQPTLQLIKEEEYQQALVLLRSSASPYANLTTQNQYNKLGKKISAGLENLAVIKIAFLANVTMNHWVDSLRFWLLLEGFKLEPYIAPIGTWHQEILDTDSPLNSFKPDITWLFLHESELKLQIDTLYNDNTAERKITQSITEIREKISLLMRNTPCITIINNIVPPTERIFGNYEGSTDKSHAAIIRRFNIELPKALPQGSTVFDIEHIASSIGLINWHDKRLWQLSKHPFSFNVQSQVAYSAARLISATKGRSKKCLVLDLDNTLWGGVIGDDGIDGIKVGSNNGTIGETYSDFQLWIKGLANRGIVLAVCSKNDLKIAQEPFDNKDGMVLKLSDFASFHANWENKADNIKQIAEEINLGLDSLVFIDDNPAERELIRKTLPQVSVPELPVDPSGYIKAIDSGKWFETLGITKEDSERAESYQQSLARETVQKSSTDLSSYLQNLEMSATYKKVGLETLVRATQLINKTNQFNMTTTRYTEAQVSKYIESKDHWVGYFSLSDRFGDLGIISIVILRKDNDKAIIDTWVMSCRVFSRGMEDYIFNKILLIAKELGQKELIGRFIATPKNGVIANLYTRLGGLQATMDSQEEKRWKFELNNPIKLKQIYIADKQE